MTTTYASAAASRKHIAKHRRRRFSPKAKNLSWIFIIWLTGASFGAIVTVGGWHA